MRVMKIGSYQQALNTPLEVVYRQMAYNDIETQIKRQKEQQE